MARTAGFEVCTVCLPISVSVMFCSSYRSHKCEAQAVKQFQVCVICTRFRRAEEWCHRCMMKQELHLVLRAVPHFEQLLWCFWAERLLFTLQMADHSRMFSRPVLNHSTRLHPNTPDHDVYWLSPVYWDDRVAERVQFRHAIEHNCSLVFDG